MKWSDLQRDFEWDGSWRDIYVFECGMAGWRVFWQLLQDPCYRAEYQRDGEAAELPREVDSIFAVRESATPRLSVFLDKIPLNCHFFSIDTIELDLDPRDVSSQASLDLLLAFMRRLGRTMAKRVTLAPENMPERPIFRYEPERDAFVRTRTEHGGR